MMLRIYNLNPQRLRWGWGGAQKFKVILSHIVMVGNMKSHLQREQNGKNKDEV